MTFEELATLIRDRRTNMFVDRDRAVPAEIAAQLCELAQWAPNHKRTWPWQFATAESDARRRLGNAIADVMQTQGDSIEKVAKSRTKYLRTPMTLVIGSMQGDSPLRTEENRDSVAAGIQNILLGATSLGLASYWASCPKGADAVVAELCSFEPGTKIVGLIYLGWPTEAVPTPERPPIVVHHMA